ncbi:MAG: glycogen synthase [bacterium]|nr:glycogen synthase [bacterium]
MRILFLAAEAAPYIKVGGLGDVAGSLPQALRRKGHEVRLMMPRYGLLDANKFGLYKIRDNFRVQMDWRNEECQLWRSKAGDYFIENQYFFGSRFQVYGCGDEIEQFVLFCRAALEACRLEGWRPDVIHAHDWHTGAAVRLAWADPNRPGTVLTIHNLAHQGNTRPQGWPLLGVYDGRGDMNLMQQAIYCADAVTTVSPTYAGEIQRPENGFGLDWLLREQNYKLSGILNGIDMEANDPATDPAIAANYSVHDLSGKAICRRRLHEEMGLYLDEGPLVGIVSRLDFQKGIDLVLRGINDIATYSNAKLLVLGSGNADYENALRNAQNTYPGKVCCYIGFDPKLARRVYAGCDIFLMPSLFEPCGLSQMLAMRYGTVPVARATGGLADTIIDCRDPRGGFGYLFGSYDHHEMLSALGNAIDAFTNHRDLWHDAMVRGMNRDFSWDRAADQYIDIYNRVKR